MPRYHNKISHPRPPAERASRSALEERFHQQKQIELPEVLQSDPLMGTRATAKALNITPVHLRRLCRAGKTPPPLKVGHRKLAWRLSTIIKFIAEREEAAKHAALESMYERPASETIWPVSARRTGGRRRR